MEAVEAIEVFPGEQGDQKNDVNTQNEADEIKKQLLEETKDKFLRVCKTITEMLQDRGFIVEPFNKDEFMAQHFPDGYTTSKCVPIIGSSQKKIQVRVYQKQMSLRDIMIDVENILGNQRIDDVSVGLDMSEYYDPIFVLPAAQKIVLKGLQQRKIQCFLYSELLINITHHMLVPKFHVLSDGEKKEFLECYKLKLGQLPKMLESDPISKYYGLKKGDVVKIMRKSVTAGKYVYYRAVI